MPETLLRARTTLLPKTARPATEAEYRPITVASVAVRQLHRILSVRLEKVVEHAECQRGLRRGVDGIGENVTALDDILNDARKKCKGLHLAVVDVEKAFDRVSHHALLSIMEGRGWPKQLVEYIEKVYLTGATTIGGGPPLRVMRGIRQGDPLSSVLFNITMDHVLLGLPDKVGYLMGGRRVGVLAFADDVVLVAVSEAGLRALMGALIGGLAEVGLNVSVAKSLYVRLLPRGGRLVIPREGGALSVRDITLRAAAPGCTWTYLGVKFGLTGVIPTRSAEVVDALTKVDRAPLKPMQKLEVIRTYVLASFLHRLVLSGTNKKDLYRIDVEARGRIRKWLRLPQDSASAYIHGPIGDGGLGIMSLRDTVPAIRRQRIEGARERRAGRAAPVPVESGIQRRYRRAAALHATVDGADLVQSREARQSTAWLRDHGLMSRGWQAVAMVRVHSGSLPSRVRCARGRRGRLPTRCRAGCNAAETAAHAVQVCPVTRLPRTGRHNYAVGTLVEYARRKGWEVYSEPHFQLGSMAYRPDAVLVNPKGTYVIDVAITGGDLAQLAAAKVTKYNTGELRTAVVEMVGGDPAKVEVLPVVLSWKGVWHAPSTAALRRIGYPSFVMEWIPAGVLAGSAMIWTAFMRATRGRRRGRPPR